MIPSKKAFVGYVLLLPFTKPSLKFEILHMPYPMRLREIQVVPQTSQNIFVTQNISNPLLLNTFQVRNMKQMSIPIDLDEILDDASLVSDSEDAYYEDTLHEEQKEHQERKFFIDPNQRILDQHASLIPGSPFSKPMTYGSNRPTEPLMLAKYASLLAFLATIGMVGYLFFAAVWEYASLGRILVECFLALLSFFGLFWNTYFIFSSIFKCFIPAKAFTSNTKYCSIIPEKKPDGAGWMNVTIQIPVYKESLREVMRPTLKSCMKARDYYQQHTKAKCNIVICDDGMMAFLKNNFPAAEMLWNTINSTDGRVLKLSKLLKHVAPASRKHLKGLRGRDIYEVFHRMLFYYHYDIGFVARSTIDRRGKFKKASNLNSHLRLAFGAAQLEMSSDISFEQALLNEAHHDDGSRIIMFGNDIRIGDLILVNDADARMAESVIVNTVPEFISDHSLGFTQHATKTLCEQRNESFYTRHLAVYTDALYQGHFQLSSIMGCHPPLVGHSIVLRSEALKQVGQIRTLQKAQIWLKNIGLSFLPVDSIGFTNLRAQNRIEYWSESHVSEDFELMIHLYNLGFNGRYCAYPDCEFQEGITRTFDEEAGRHRKFALGAHELVFNPFSEMFGKGIFTPLFRTFLSCDIPSYYKIFLTAYLCSYTSGGTYLIVFSIAAITRLLDQEENVQSIYNISPAGIIVLNIGAFYVLGYSTFLISLVRMYWNNKNILFPEYRKKFGGAVVLVFKMLYHCLTFQFLFYTVSSITFYFLGSMDHLLARPGVVSATNKDSITVSRCVAFWEMAKFNFGSWCIGLMMAGLAWCTILQDNNWDYTKMPTDVLKHALFSGPPLFLAFMTVFSPIALNPFILGWPFHRRLPKVESKKRSRTSSRDASGKVLNLNAYIETSKALDAEIEMSLPDVELGSLHTKDIFSHSSSPALSVQKKLERTRLGRETSDKYESMKRIDEALPSTRSSSRSRDKNLARQSRTKGNTQRNEI